MHAERTPQQIRSTLTLRKAMEGREGVARADFQISRERKAFAIERYTGSPDYRRRVTAIVFGTCRSDALRAASVRLAEEIHGDVTHAEEITSGWDEPVVWPDFGGYD